jgi:hypothetical protein
VAIDGTSLPAKITPHEAIFRDVLISTAKLNLSGQPHI